MSAIIDRETFEKNYTVFIARTWSDPGFKESVIKNPGAALNEVALPVAADAHVNVVSVAVSSEAATGSANGPAAGALDEQYALWVKGSQTGNYELRLPEVPSEFALSDEALAGISGGAMTAAACCCCPCCCCCGGRAEMQ
jgi:hypothetical protein